MVRTKLTRENWEKNIDHWLVDWNDRESFESDQPVRGVKEFIKQLLEDITGEEK